MSTTHLLETMSDASYWYRQFQLQRNLKDGLRARLRQAEADFEEHRRVVAEALALHHESKWTEDVSYCVLRASRWRFCRVAPLPTKPSTKERDANQPQQLRTSVGALA